MTSKLQFDFSEWNENLDSLRSSLEEVFQAMSQLRKLGQMPFWDLYKQESENKKLEARAKTLSEQFDHLLVIGVGGSSLGAKMLLQSLASPLQKKRVTVCDTVDEESWEVISQQIDFKKTLVLVVSKSGNTLETLAAFSFFQKKMKPVVNLKNHVVVITDSQNGFLRKLATQEGYESFTVPAGVGGRFSVLTAVGLFPAAFAGIKVQKILEGMSSFDAYGQNKDVLSHPAMISAAGHFLNHQKKQKNIRVMMSYGERLREFPHWYAQLWAESLGKKHDLKGNVVHTGTTLIPAIGPQDQHSQLQLYLDGPDDKSITFLALDLQPGKTGKNLDGFQDSSVSFWANHTAHDILKAERLATQKALSESGRTTNTILLNQKDQELEPMMGELILFSELETVISGGLYQINPFDQPAVERIKKNIPSFLNVPLTKPN